jgi:hypothetical protein
MPRNRPENSRRKHFLWQSIVWSQNWSDLINHHGRPKKLPSDPVASPRIAYLETKRSSREAERWREDEQSEDENHLSASLAERVEDRDAQVRLSIDGCRHFDPVIYRGVEKSVHAPPTRPILNLPQIWQAPSTGNDLPIPVIYFICHKHFRSWK